MLNLLFTLLCGAVFGWIIPQPTFMYPVTKFVSEKLKLGKFSTPTDTDNVVQTVEKPDSE